MPGDAAARCIGIIETMKTQNNQGVMLQSGDAIACHQHEPVMSESGLLMLALALVYQGL